MLRWLLWIIGILAAAALGFYAYMGGFNTVAVTKTQMPAIEFVFAKHRGTYAKLNEAWGAFMPEWQEAKLGTCLTIGVYLDPPGTPGEKLRSLIGCRIDEWTDEQKAAARAKFPTLTIPASEAYTASFPFRNFLSFFLAPAKVYPAIEAELKKDGNQNKLGVELYGSFDDIREIKFLVPVAKDTSAYRPLYDAFEAP
jgi:hypothetical protein